MRLLSFAVLLALMQANPQANGQPRESGPSQALPHGGALPNPVAARLQEATARMRFAPMWMPVPKYMPVKNGSDALLPPAPAYDSVWHPKWQDELGLSGQQKEDLRSIHAAALATVKKQTEHFQGLSPAQQSEQVKSWGGEPAPWRKQLDHDIARRIEAVLTAKQAQTLRDQALPGYIVGLLYDAKQRGAIGFAAEQENRFRQLARERLARFQEVWLESAERKWNLLTLAQQAEMPNVVQQQGPTSAVLSVAWGLGFELDNLVPGYPLLGEVPVRQRLGLHDEQERQLREITAQSTARREKLQLELRSGKAEASREASAAEAMEKREVETVLTPRQLTLLQELHLRRKFALALEYPEKRRDIGFSAEQTTRLAQLDQEAHDRTYRIDREMLAQAIAILSPQQQKQAEQEIGRLVYGARTDVEHSEATAT